MRHALRATETDCCRSEFLGGPPARTGTNSMFLASITNPAHSCRVHVFGLARRPAGPWASTIRREGGHALALPVLLAGSEHADQLA
jgi:hypothetical protein